MSKRLSCPIGFNAQHSPMGAFMSFTCGHPGTKGGIGLQIGQPANLRNCRCTGRGYAC